MIATPRAGLWTPRGRQAPSLMLPYGVAGTSPIGVHSRSGSAPTITRAGTRWFQAGASIVELAANTHCMEQDGAGVQYVSVYGEYTNSITRSVDRTFWYEDGVTGSDAGVASPITGYNWNRLVETDGNNNHYASLLSASAPAQNQKNLTQAFVANGDRRYIVLRAARTGQANILLDTVTGTIVDTLVTDPVTLHAYGAKQVGAGWKLWLVWSDSGAVPLAPYIQVFLNNGATINTDLLFVGSAATYPLGMLWTGAMHVVGASGPLPYIHAHGAVVTKSAEIISYPVADLGIPGSVELHARTWDTVPTNKRLWAWYDASTDAAIELFLDSAAHVHLRVHDGTSENADIEVATAINTGAWFPVTASWEHNYVRLRVGSTDAIDTTCALPALADLDVCIVGGGEGTGGQCFDGHIRDFRCYKYRRI